MLFLWYISANLNVIPCCEMVLCALCTHAAGARKARQRKAFGTLQLHWPYFTCLKISLQMTRSSLYPSLSINHGKSIWGITTAWYLEGKCIKRVLWARHQFWVCYSSCHQWFWSLSGSSAPLTWRVRDETLCKFWHLAVLPLQEEKSNSLPLWTWQRCKGWRAERKGSDTYFPQRVASKE